MITLRRSDSTNALDSLLQRAESYKRQREQSKNWMWRNSHYTGASLKELFERSRERARDEKVGYQPPSVPRKHAITRDYSQDQDRWFRAQPAHIRRAHLPVVGKPLVRERIALPYAGAAYRKEEKGLLQSLTEKVSHWSENLRERMRSKPRIYTNASYIPAYVR